ncbi:Rapamycin-insensitive companion of mTOR [Geodia barretti]|nr:Rapamycin-insensitive companion of mTOR [Geodia barretti]
MEENQRAALQVLDMSVVQASKMAAVSMLKTWPGLFCLCSPHNTGLVSLLNMLPLTQMEVQREILDLLYCVFQLKVPTWTEHFQEAIASVDPVQPKGQWSFTEGFVVEEGKDLLPPKYGSRTNLVNCFHALLLAVLIEEGVFECLVEVVRTGMNHVRVMTTILMGQLLHMANSILPSEFSSDTHCLTELISSAMDFDTHAERNRATEVISYLDRVHQQKKEGVKPSSPYLRLILEQARYTSQPKQEQELLKLIPSEMEDGSVLALVRDTDVPVVPTKEYMKWKWNLIFSVLQHPSIRTPQVMEDATFGKFVKRLCNFFKPSGHLFALIRFSEANQKKFSTVGKLLVKFMCCVEENFSSHLVALLTDIVNELSQVTASKVTADVFSASSIANKLARDYFLLLGTISYLRPALLEQCKAYGPLLDICNYQNRTDLMKLVLSTLDFGNVHCRVILSKLLTSTDKEMRLYATRHMRVLLRAKMPFFNSWGLELLVPQLYDLERRVALEAVEILDEACEEENFLEALLLQQPALLHLGEKGAAVFTRFISIRRGFTLLQKLMLFESLMEKWYSTYSKLYVYIVEERLAEALTSFKIVDEGQFIRRTDSSVIQPEAFVPVHFYGQIVQHEEGCAMLDKMGHVKKFCEVIQQDTPVTKEDITSYKAAIWALGHIGSTQQGLDLLLTENAVEELIDLAEDCPLLSIRGTCYYSLCLISKTKAGANVLLENNWITVQHSAEEKWPLIFDSKQELDDAAPFSPDTRPVRFFPPLFGSFDLNSLPRTSRLPKALSYQVLNAPYSRSEHHLGSSLSLSAHTTSSLKKADSGGAGGGARKTPPPLRVLGVRKPGRKLFASVKERDRGRRSPSLSRLRGRSTADIRGHAHTLGLGQSRAYSISTGELLSPELHKASSPLSCLPQTLPQPLQRVTSLGLPHRSKTSANSTFFIGVCIPIEISTMFEYSEEEYKGFRTRTCSAPNFEVATLPHDPASCLECSLTYRQRSSSSLSSLPQQSLLAGPAQSSGGSHGTDTSSTAGSGGGSYVSKDKSLDATPSPDAPRTLHLHVGSSQENVTDGGDSSDGGGGARGVASNTPRDRGLTMKDLPVGEKKRGYTSGSPLVRMKKILSEERIEEVGADEEDGDKLTNEVIAVSREERKPRGRLKELSEMSEGGNGERVGPVKEQGDEEGEDGMTTEDDETDDEELEGEEEEEEEGDDSISPVKEILINVVSASARSNKDSVAAVEGGAADDAVSVSSVLTTQSTDLEPALSGRHALHKAVLEIIYSLSSDVSLKKNSQGLNQVCQKYTELGDDLCLYSKVVDMFSTYHYNLLTRRFIQSKFQHMTYDPLFAAKTGVEDPFVEDDLMSSSTASSRRESYCSTEGGGGAAGEVGRWRSSSSTSDALRFRQRMQQTSSHEEAPSNLQEEGPVRQNSSTSSSTAVAASGESQSNESRRTEPEIKIIAASVSSHESTDSSRTTPGTSKSSGKRATSTESHRDKSPPIEVEDSGKPPSSTRHSAADKVLSNQTTTTRHNGSRSSSEVRYGEDGRGGGGGGGRDTSNVDTHSPIEKEPYDL